MKTNISEELPARKHAPAAPAKGAKGAPAKGAAGKKQGGGSPAENSEKRIRQAVYDIRYRARREDIDLKQAFSQYMSNSSLNPAERKAVKEKLFGKKGGMAESHSVDSVDWAVDSVAGALYKVFVEGVDKEEEKIELEYANQLAEEQERKYKVRVTDPKSKRSYVRYATREKITALRGKGLKVEMTEYGEPYEGERKRGERTARALGGGRKEVPNNKSGLDKPVHPSKRDGDVNDDGKKDKTDSYIYNRRDAIRKAMKKEDYLWFEGTTSVEGQNRVPAAIDVGQKVDNSKRITVFPDDGSNPQNNGGVLSAGNEMEGPFLTEKAKSKSQQKFMAMVCQVKKGKMEAPSAEVAKAAAGMSEKDACDYAETKHKGLPEKKEMKEEAETCPKCGKSPCECRAREGYRIALQNKFRALGAKNPIILGDIDHKRFTDIMSKDKVSMKDACG
jgi:hypothetical protein